MELKSKYKLYCTGMPLITFCGRIVQSQVLVKNTIIKQFKNYSVFNKVETYLPSRKIKFNLVSFFSLCFFLVFLHLVFVFIFVFINKYVKFLLPEMLFKLYEVYNTENNSFLFDKFIDSYRKY